MNCESNVIISYTQAIHNSDYLKSKPDNIHDEGIRKLLINMSKVLSTFLSFHKIIKLSKRTFIKTDGREET